jgi:hypothetical protein
LSVSRSSSQTKNNIVTEKGSKSRSRSVSHPKKKTPERKKKEKDTINSYIVMSPSSSRRVNPDENPNEPADNYEIKSKGPVLKKELQRILSHQSWNQFNVLNATPTMRRVTRNTLNKNKLRKNKKYHYNQGL